MCNSVWAQPEYYFVEKSPFNILQKVNHPWNYISTIPEFINAFFENYTQNYIPNELSLQDTEIFVSKTIKLKKPLIWIEKKIFLADNVLLEAGATIKSKCIILSDTTVRQSAYIRENVLIGNKCVIGHASEVKNSIIFNSVEAGHFNYIGDSVVGSYTNLGAGTKLCNLAFRSYQQKKEHIFPTIKLKIKEKQTNIEFEKMGCIIGEGTETGCNSVIGPMSFLGKFSRVFPNIYVSNGVYPEKSIFRTSQDYLNIRL